MAAKRFDLSGYRRAQLLGRGNDAVYRYEAPSRPSFALKVVTKGNFLGELDVLRRALKQNASNIVELVGYDLKRQCLIMELVDAGTLRDLMRLVQFEEKHVAYTASEVLKGLVELHSLGFVHYDIKPANILLNSSGRMKLADFGLALREGSRMLGQGTDGYNSPEVLLSRARRFVDRETCSSKADQFSLGCVVVQLYVDANISYIDPSAGEVAMDALVNGKNVLNVLREMDKYGALNRAPLRVLTFLEQALRADATERPAATELLRHALVTDCAAGGHAGVAAAAMILAAKKEIDAIRAKWDADSAARRATNEGIVFKEDAAAAKGVGNVVRANAGGCGGDRDRRDAHTTFHNEFAHSFRWFWEHLRSPSGEISSQAIRDAAAVDRYGHDGIEPSPRTSADLCTGLERSSESEPSIDLELSAESHVSTVEDDSVDELDDEELVELSLTRGQDKLYRCRFTWPTGDDCDYFTDRRSNMTTHLKRHTGEKPFGCDVCGQRYRQRATFDRHFDNKKHLGNNRLEQRH